MIIEHNGDVSPENWQRQTGVHSLLHRLHHIHIKSPLTVHCTLHVFRFVVCVRYPTIEAINDLLVEIMIPAYFVHMSHSVYIEINFVKLWTFPLFFIHSQWKAFVCVCVCVCVYISNKSNNQKQQRIHCRYSPLETGYSAMRGFMQRACKQAGEWGLRITWPDGHWRWLSEYKVDLMTLYLSTVKSGYMDWRCGLARGQNSCRILVDEQFGQRPLAWRIRHLKDNIRMHFRELECKSGKWNGIRSVKYLGHCCHSMSYCLYL